MSNYETIPSEEDKIDTSSEVDYEEKNTSEPQVKPYPQFDDRYLFEKENTYHDSIPKDERIRTNDESIDRTRNWNTFSAIQKWKGYITEIHSDYFVGRLEDLTKGGTDELADIPFREISDDDKEMIKEGRVFYWSIGYQNNQGQIEKISIIRFQRLVEWEEGVIDKVQSKVSQLIHNIDV